MENFQSRIEIRMHSRVTRLHAHQGMVAEVSFEICYYILQCLYLIELCVSQMFTNCLNRVLEQHFINDSIFLC